MGRICAVLACSNSTYTLAKWNKQLCEKHGTFFINCSCLPPFDLFPFPTEIRDPEGRKRWVKLINRKTKAGKNWEPSYQDRVCSIHFEEGEPTPSFPDPTKFLGYDAASPSYSIKGKRPRKPPRVRVSLEPRLNKIHHANISKRKEPDFKLPTMESQETPDESTEPPSKQQALAHHDYATPLSNVSPECHGCSEKANKIQTLQRKVKKLQQSLKNFSHTEGVTCAILKTDKSVRLFTGLQSKQKLECLFLFLSPKVDRLRYWSGSKKVSTIQQRNKGKRTPQKPGPARMMCKKDELVMVLLKLRLGLTLAFLSSLFNVSCSTSSQIFNTWVKFLSNELKPLVYWPDKATILENMPPSLKGKYPSLRCTLDCTEVFIERPRNLEIQALTWSDYKKHNTVKFLVGIAPNGMVTFLSKAWGGRASDVHITRESGFFDLVDPGDIILADRGFTIKEDLLIKQAKLEIPPPSKGKEQQSPQEVAKTKRVANARIHVERAIGRMKQFEILKETLPITLVPLVDDIIIVCAALVNLLPPLVSN